VGQLVMYWFNTKDNYASEFKIKSFIFSKRKNEA
jgi:hypothetical protein